MFMESGDRPPSQGVETYVEDVMEGEGGFVTEGERSKIELEAESYRCDAPVASLLELFNASFTAPRRSSNSVSFKLEKGSMSGGGEDEDDALGLAAATLTHSPGFVIVVICSGPDGAQMVSTSISARVDADMVPWATVCVATAV